MMRVSIVPPDLSDEDWTRAYSGTTRDAYRRTLLAMARDDARIICVDSDMGGFEDSFGAELPNQYVNVGIAEANMVGISAGMAAIGLIPFANTMSAFASARACEQVKLDVAVNNLPVRIVGTHGGFSAGHYGPTHHALNDLAIMRSMPNMTVIAPADTVEATSAVRAAVDWPGPVFIRLGRGETPLIYQRPYDFEIGRAVTLIPGGDVSIIAIGPLPVGFALDAGQRLGQLGVSARVVNMHTVMPVDQEAVLLAADATQGIVTVEDHLVSGGLGDAVAEIVGANRPCPVRRIGVRYGHPGSVGDERDLLAEASVTPEDIVSAAVAITGDRRRS
jgi:transketolase